jgi:hypothetical protein
VYWSIEEVRAEAPEGKEVPGWNTNDDEDGCNFNIDWAVSTLL